MWEYTNNIQSYNDKRYKSENLFHNDDHSCDCGDGDGYGDGDDDDDDDDDDYYNENDGNDDTHDSI